MIEGAREGEKKSFGETWFIIHRPTKLFSSPYCGHTTFTE